MVDWRRSRYNSGVKPYRTCRIIGASPQVGSTSVPVAVSYGPNYARQQHHEVTLPGRNPLHEDIVQTAVWPHPAIAGPHLLPGASIGDISPIDDGTPLILEWTR